MFTFKQQNPDCYYIGVTYSFLAENSNKDQAQPLEAPPAATALPTFNTDQLYFTPSFVLTTDQVRPTPLRITTAATSPSRSRNFRRKFSKPKISSPTR